MAIDCNEVFASIETIKQARDAMEALEATTTNRRLNRQTDGRLTPFTHQFHVNDPAQIDNHQSICWWRRGLHGSLHGWVLTIPCVAEAGPFFSWRVVTPTFNDEFKWLPPLNYYVDLRDIL